MMGNSSRGSEGRVLGSLDIVMVFTVLYDTVDSAQRVSQAEAAQERQPAFPAGHD